MISSALTRRSPSNAFVSRDPFFRFVDSMLRDGWTGEGAESTGAWTPSVDVRETEDAYIVTAELPGLNKDDVEVRVEDNVLSLRGERRFENEENRDSYRRIERAYGSFHRSFSLPTHIDSAKVKAGFENGLLTLTVPKAETAKARTIKIS